MIIEKVASADESNVTPLSGFLSYTSKNKKLARLIKKELSFFGIGIFVFQKDIPAGKYGLDTITKSIKNCDFFMPLLTADYHTSPYTNQELGMALALGKCIIPISFDKTLPEGFAEDIQCEPMKKNKKSYQKLVNDIPELNHADWLIVELSRSKNHYEANMFIKEIESLMDRDVYFNPMQINRIHEAALSNEQVSKAQNMKRLRRYIKENYEKDYDSKYRTTA